MGENVIRNFWKGWRKYGVGSPGPSYIETGIEWNRIEARGKGIAWNFGGISEGWEFNGYFSAYISLLLLQAYLSGSDVKPLLSQGLEEISVSVGSEIRRLGKGGTKICISLYSSTPICGNSMATFLWLRCETMMAARIRRKFCQYSIGCEIRKLWKGWRKYASLFYSSTRCGTIMVARLRRNFCQYRMWN